MILFRFWTFNLLLIILTLGFLPEFLGKLFNVNNDSWGSVVIYLFTCFVCLKIFNYSSISGLLDNAENKKNKSRIRKRRRFKVFRRKNR